MESPKKHAATSAHKEIVLEQHLVSQLVHGQGYAERSPEDYDRPLALDTALLLRLSVWWLRLGIEIERIKPGCPQQNGRHERMHLTLKLETTKPAGANFLQQQAKFDDFIECTIPRDRTKRSTCAARPSDTRPHAAPTEACPTSTTRSTIRPS
jgi:putative transposase